MSNYFLSYTQIIGPWMMTDIKCKPCYMLLFSFIDILNQIAQSHILGLAVALSGQDGRHSAVALLLKAALIQVSDYRLLGASGL
jgi:hypothetical protein